MPKLTEMAVLLTAAVLVAAGRVRAEETGDRGGRLAVSATETGGGLPQAPTVLDLQRGSFRGFLRWKTPGLASQEGELKPLLEPKRRDSKEGEARKPFPIVESSPPPKEWTQCRFDDSQWPRVRGAVVVVPWFGASVYTPGNPAEWNLVCVRGKWRVTDPQQVRGLKLHASYYGGIVVYVNGVELCRGHLRPGKSDLDAVGEPYPDEAYVRPDGRRYGEGDEKAFAERMKCRIRALPPRDAPDGVAIPAAMLRKGVNVIALETRAAPLRELAVTAAEGPVTWRGSLTPWPHAGIVEARLTAESAAGLVPNAAPSQSIELWACQPLETVSVRDFSDPSESALQIRIVGARNGTFSGKVVLGSAAAIRNAKATVSGLVHAEAGNKVQAIAVQVRRAELASPEWSWNRPDRFDRLVPDFPAELAPVSIRARDEKLQAAPAAVVPVWVTARVPADAAPGQYRGVLHIEAEGAAKASFDVPIHLTVADWALPDSKDFVTHHDIYQSPETVALYYKVPLWGDKHFELIGRSLEVLRDVANKLCVLNLAVKSSNMGNSESMVRWVRQPDGSTKHDFAIVDRYLDLYAQKAGKPGILCLNVWGHLRKEDKQHQPPLSVSVLDPTTGKIEAVSQPPYGTPENLAFWRPVLLELRKRLEKRGWFDVAAVCYASYCWAPPKEMVDVYKAIWPDGKWMNASHSNPTSFSSMPCPYSEWVWGCGSLYCPETSTTRQYPRAWKRGAERIELGNPRVGVGFITVFRDYSPLVAYRTITEAAMQGGLRGLGRVGGDFWPLALGTAGKLVPLCDAQFAIGPVNNTVALTSPGPDGAAFNERLEMFREGVQVAEAIVFVQRALEARQLDAGLARRIEALLDERARYYLRTLPGQQANWWSLEASDWQDRDARLFSLAAEVARANRP